MSQTIIQKGFRPFKKYLPSFIANPIRSCMTAILTPIRFSLKTGHFKSSFKMSAVANDGSPLPWYTYPTIDFLKNRSYEGKVVMEFGGGQSTLWWAKRAKQIVTFEGNQEWYDKIKKSMPSNVDLYCVTQENVSACIANIEKILAEKKYPKFDVVVIDGLFRHEMTRIAMNVLSEDGVIIADNAESYPFFETYKDYDFSRVDFYGNAPGVVLPHCTSIFFKGKSFLFSPKFKIANMALEG